MVKESKLQRKNIILLFGIVVLILIGIFRTQLSSLFGVFYGVTIDKAIRLTNQERESFNIALLGIAGAKHDGPDLSDTIIIANVNVKQNKVHMFSIPRDLWVPSANDKINAIYANAKEKGRGIPAVEEVLERISGQKIDYVLVLDFEGFTKMVDHLGGIDVNVTQPLYDFNYPIEGLEDDSCGKSDEEIKAFTATASAEVELWDYFPCRYKQLRIEKGLVQMDGQKALEFVRSRHGEGAEGSDFARSRRQQIVISSLKDKAFSLGVILNPVKLVGIYNILKENIDWNIDMEQVDDFIKLANKLQDGEVRSYVLDEGNDINKYGLLKHPPISDEYRLKWVLTPRVGNGNYSEIKNYISCVIQNIECEVGRNGIISPTPFSKK